MASNFLKILWLVIIFLFISLQVYNLIKSNYADVVTSLLTVIILLAMILSFGLISNITKAKKLKKGEKENQ